MRLVTFVLRADVQAVPRVGALLASGEIADLQAGAIAMLGDASPRFASMLHLLDDGPVGLEQARRVLDHVERQRPPAAVVARADATLLAPVPRPRSIRDCMVTEGHVIGCMRAIARRRWPLLAAADSLAARFLGRGLLRPPSVWYRQPIYYKGTPHSVVGPDADIRWPRYSRRLDYELEFGFFIGREGRDIPKERAIDFIAGYTIFNDFSARDAQGREMAARLGPAKGKDFDTGNAMGPCLTTVDEVPDPSRLAMVARINGHEWSRGTSASMHHRIEDIIAFISQDETLYPGDFIGCGTVAGGCGLELDRWLAPGDVVELDVERLGVLRNRVVRPDAVA